MDRGRSSLARHRRRRLQEATQHVSAAHELAVPAAIARLRCFRPRAGDGQDTSAAVNDAIRVLRNAKNGVYHRGLAARALGLLMLHDQDVAAHLRLEAEDLVDALLQLVNYCRRAGVQSADTRRVHVNCCLVISLLMQVPNHQQQQHKASLVVALDSELLVMDSKPTEASSSFLLLTVSGQPESGDATLRSTATDQHSDADRVVADITRKPSKLGVASPTRHQHVTKTNNQHESPTKERKVAWTTKEQQLGCHQRTLPQSTRTHPAQQLPVFAPPADALAASAAGRSTPARVFKMDRFRVVTPAFASANAQQILAGDVPRWSSSPVVNPTGGCVMGGATPSLSNNSELASPRSEASPTPASPASLVPPSPSASLMHPQHMLEILRTQQMPVASPAFFTRRLRESISRQGSSRMATEVDGGAPTPANRRSVVTWGEWKRSRGADRSDESDKLQEEVEEEEEEDRADSAEAPSSKQQSSHHPSFDSSQPTITDTSQAQLSNTPEAKRQRLREILASPVEPFEKNALHLRSLACRVDSTAMAAFDVELQTLTREEHQVREQLHAFIQDERDRLPLKFLFALPGGAEYCRYRMRRAMARWIYTFEQNQQRLALLQWKALIEHRRFVERGAAYHARAVQLRLKVAIAYVVRNFQQQAIRRWVLVTQTQIWLARDQAARVVQARVRQFLMRQRTLQAHRRARFGIKPPPGWPQLRDDVCLASPRTGVSFRVPLEIRQDLRARWRAATSVQQRLRRRRFRAYLSRYRAAATKIQSAARMRAERARFAAIKKQIIAFQARVRMVACRSVYVRLRDAALLVQRAVRDSRARRLRRLVKCAHFRLLEYKLTGALRVQRLVRGFLGRRRAKAIRCENAERFHAALVVQRAWYRRNNEFSTFLLLGCLREQESEDLAFDASVFAFTRATAANHIRRSWAAFLFSKRDMASRRIQRAARGFISRQRVEMLRRRRIARRRIKWFLRVRHADRVRTAARIQFAWLRAVPGRLLRHLRNLRARTELEDARRWYELVFDAASRLQALVRGYFQGRRLAKRERSARVTQRTYRAIISRKRHKEKVARLRAEAAERAAQHLLVRAIESMTARRLAAMNSAAVQVQRVARGFVARANLVTIVVQRRCEQQMASRIQRIWRENAWRRAFAQRARASRSILEVQRRRQSPSNPFRDVSNTPGVLERTLALTAKYLDPADELSGVNVHEWLRRNGLSARYGVAFQKRAASDGGIDNALLFMAQLRELDEEQCRDRLRAIMSKAAAISSGDSDDDVDLDVDVDALVMNLLASRTLREARELRRQLARDQRRHREHFQVATERKRQQLAGLENIARHCQRALDAVLHEADDFRNPPRALCLQRDACEKDLQQATRVVEAANRELEAARAREEAHVQLLAQWRDKIQRDVAPREVAARASLEGIRVLSDDGAPSERDQVARALFLDRFPGLEARAAAFSSALAADGGSGVTRTQLARFLGLQPRRRKELMLSDVKLAMPELTQSRYADTQGQHDLRRFTMCADLLQLGLERLGELLGVSLEALALGRSPREDAQSCQSRVETTIVDVLERSRARPERLPAAEHRARALRGGVDALVELNAASTTLQTRWRSRAGRKLLLELRLGHRRAAVKAQYVAERSKDHVTPLWERERQLEQEEAQAWEMEQRQLARLEALVAVPRFPFVFRAWHYELGAYVYRAQEQVEPVDSVQASETEEDEYELEGQHSTYSIAEDAAAIKIQAGARGRLARRLVTSLQRAQRRQRRRDAMERAWDAAGQERKQLLTLNMDFSAAADARVQLWWRQRRQPLVQSMQPQPPTRPRKLAAAATSAEPVTNADHELDETMRALLAPVELAYHRSVRSEHRREWLFPAAARGPNAHARATLELLRASERFQRVWAPRGRVSWLSLRHTKAALRFGWREVRQATGPRYFVHATTEETSWTPPPPYAFAESAAATTLQAFARQLAARREREHELSRLSLAAVVHAAVDRVTRLGGWTGFGLEGFTAAAALCLVGLARLLPSLGAAHMTSVVTADDLRAVPADVLRKQLQWSADDVAALQLLPTVDRRAKSPLSPTWSSPTSTAGTTPAFPPSSPAWWPPPLQLLPSVRVINQLVAKRFPNQQGRAQVLVRAVAASTTIISYRQLDLHLRRYGGRPDEAAGAAAMRELADLPPLVRAAAQERAAFLALAHALDRVLVLAANLGLRALQAELSVVCVVTWRLVQPDGDEQVEAARRRVKQTLPLNPGLSALALERETLQALALPRTKGMWEHEPANGITELSAAQAAQFVRVRGLERVLRWERAARLVQSLARMWPARRHFREWQAARQTAARTLQRVVRGHTGREEAARLAAQRASDFDQARDPRSGVVYFVFTPTRERFVDEPVDAEGRAVAFRPLVRDRVTQRWLLAWPGFDKSRRGASKQPTDDATTGASTRCSSCRVARAARRCLECASPSGDFLDLCLACFADAHAAHGFSALARHAAAALRCVECGRWSSRRCLRCDEHYCARCFRRVHARGHRRVLHRSEAYAERAAACADCELRVAERRCLDCGDALCLPCLERSHGKPGARRAAHKTELLAQPLGDPASETHCAQCHARRADERCGFCAAPLCAVCLEERREAHAEALGCPETALELARAQLLGEDALCADCGRPADRECLVCGDRYCSARWMGHAGCFERFHAKGRRAQHEWQVWHRPAVDEQREAVAAAKLAAIEEQVRAKRRQDARAAEAEAASLAAALRVDTAEAAKAEAAKAGKTRKRKKKSRKKAGVCTVDQCTARSVGVALPFCLQHLTPQHALEVARGDPLEAAKLLADAQRDASGGGGDGVGKRLARMLAALRATQTEDKGKSGKGKRAKAVEASGASSTTQAIDEREA